MECKTIVIMDKYQIKSEFDNFGIIKIDFYNSKLR